MQTRPLNGGFWAPCGCGGMALNYAAEAEALKVLVAIEEPLSRLVAAGVWLRRQDMASSGHTGVIALAIDTASQQGWRRPLAAWLTRQIRVAQAAGDTATVQRAQARLAIVLDGVRQE
jgi:hypothetical protein